MPINSCDKYNEITQLISNDLFKLKNEAYIVVASGETEHAEDVVADLTIHTGQLLQSIQSCEAQERR
jgi:hypothetical protein